MECCYGRDAHFLSEALHCWKCVDVEHLGLNVQPQYTSGLESAPVPPNPFMQYTPAQRQSTIARLLGQSVGSSIIYTEKEEKTETISVDSVVDESHPLVIHRTSSSLDEYFVQVLGYKKKNT